MKKRILTIITILTAFFGLFCLTPANHILAAGDQVTTDSDLAAINIPDSAIMSFPVTYISAHGNTITWTVEEGQDIIVYDEEAHWMVVNRPTEGETQEIDVTVTITGEGEAVSTKTVTVSVPSGYTAVPSYTIEYRDENGDAISMPEGTKTSYKLGEASYTLPTPTKDGYTFDGWYNESTKVEKVLVGSMANLKLTAKWNKVLTPLVEENISLDTTSFTYNGSEQKPVVTVTHSGVTLKENKDYTLAYSSDLTNQGEKEVKITGMGDYSGEFTKTYTINKATLELTPNKTKTAVYGATTPTWSLEDFDIEGFKNSETSSVIKGELSVTYDKEVKNADTYTATFTGLSADNYELTINKGTLIINKKDLTLSAAQKSINVGIALPIWTIDDLTAKGLVEGDVLANILTGTLSVTYKQGGTTVETPSATGEYTVILSGLSADNYNVTINESSLVISSANIVITQTSSPYTYDGTAKSLEVLVTDNDNNPLTGGTITYNGAESYSKTNAGSYEVVVNFSHPEHGTKSETFTLVINARTVTLTPNPVSAKYYATPVAAGYTVSDGEILEADLEELNIQVSIDGEDNITISHETTTNYNITLNSAKVTRTKLAITVTANPATSAYSDALAELTYVISGEDYEATRDETAVKALLSIATNATTSSDKGEYDITLSATTSEIYDVTTVNAKYTITAKDASGATVTLLGSDYNISAGTTSPAVTVVLNTVTIDAANYDVSHTDNTVAGTATVTVAFKGNYEGEVSLNYTITESGKAHEDAQILKAKYDSLLTSTVITIPEFDTEVNGSQVSWTSVSTGLDINPDGTRSYARLAGQDQTFTVIATIKYGETSADALTYTFTLKGYYTLDTGNTNVIIENASNEYEVTANEVTESETADYMISTDEQVITGYDITFTKDNVKESNPGNVTVKMLVPADYRNDPSLKIYHVNSDNTLTAVESFTIDSNGYAVFQASEFSPYIMTIAKEATPEVPSTTKKFVKVTETPTDWSGTYLIVYEAGNVAFDGSLGELDTVGNVKEVNISNNEIAYSSELEFSTFTIATIEGGYSIKSFSGLYIGRKSSKNGFDSDTESVYVNTISMNSDATVAITGEGNIKLQYYKTSGSNRFRFYASAQQAITLYKLIEE